MNTLKVVKTNEGLEYRCPKCDLILAIKPKRKKEIYFVSECQHFTIKYLMLREYMQLVNEDKVALAQIIPNTNIFITIVLK